MDAGKLDIGKWQGGAGLRNRAFGVGVLGLGVSLAGMATNPELGFHAYLVGFLYWLAISLGALAFLLICHTTKAKWMTALRRPIETMAAAAPIFVLLFVPVILGMVKGSIYWWAHPPADVPAREMELLHHKAAYLNVMGWSVRAVVFFLAWIVISQRFWSLSHAQDEAKDPSALLVKMRNFAPGVLPVLAFSLTFAAVDWIMSLEPLWFSTIFGAYYFAAGFVSFFSLLAIVSNRARGKDLFGSHLTMDHFHNFGKLMFAFSCFWGYIAFSQFMLIWVANLPDETGYFMTIRGTGAWRLIGKVLIFGHFFVPFFALVSRVFKLKMNWLMLLAGWILLMNYVDMFWMVMPSAAETILHHDATQGFPKVPAILYSLASTVGVGGIAIGFAVNRLRGKYTVPINDPYLGDSLRYQQP